MTQDDPGSALRHRLAEALQASGDLRSAPWRRAVEIVPRHLFLPEFFQMNPASTGVTWEPITPQLVGREGWLERVYQNTTWVTQVDGHERPSHTASPVTGEPTSSTLPGLVVRMLEDLQVGDRDRVLEIGTGSGYSTALLCQRLTGDQVVSLDIGPEVAQRAIQALHSAG